MNVCENLHKAFKKSVRINGGQVKAAKKFSLTQGHISRILRRSPPFSVSDPIGEKMLIAVRDDLPKEYGSSPTLSELKSMEVRINAACEANKHVTSLLKAASKRISHYDWIVLTNAFSVFANQLHASAIDMNTNRLRETF